MKKNSSSLSEMSKIKFSRVELSDLQEFSESFSNLEIINLVNVRANNVGETETQNLASTIIEPEASTSSNAPARNPGGTGNPDATFIYAPESRTRGRARDSFYGPKKSPWGGGGGGTLLEPIQPYGTLLNLDVLDFRNIEKFIDE
ncbi:hypothetical protein ACS0TY_002652 [Phlomoides rotata]